jgi:hypothetical protein
MRESLIESLVRLRRAQRQGGTAIEADLSAVSEALEELVGPTVRPAEAARLLGVSAPALHRWLDSGDIATVLTPRGRREVPVSELLDLLEEVDEARREGGGRPLTRVINERRRRAEDEVNIARLLPRRTRRTHRTAELQSLAYHRLIAERLDTGAINEARRRLDRWHKEGRVDQRWHEEWARVLEGSISEIGRTIAADTKKARELRQTSPFAGMLTEQERRRLVDAVEARAHG